MFQQATPSDSGNYTCAPANYRQHSVIVNVIKGEESPFSIFFLSQYQNVNLHPEERLNPTVHTLSSFAKKSNVNCNYLKYKTKKNSLFCQDYNKTSKYVMPKKETFCIQYM